MGFFDNINEYLEPDENILDTQELFDVAGIKYGNVLIYDSEKQMFDCIPSIGQMNKESNVIGIVVKHFLETNEVDVVLKNYLTSNGIPVPYTYMGKEKHIPAYLKDLFDRYLSKYVRNSVIDISSFNFFIPEISQLDYLDQHFDKFEQALYDIWDKERADIFLDRFYTNGIFATHKKKCYQWLPVKDSKRQINNLTYNKCYEMLPIFRFSLNNCGE